MGFNLIHRVSRSYIPWRTYFVCYPRYIPMLPTVYPYVFHGIIYDLHGVYTTTPTVYRHSHSVNRVVHGIYTLHGIYLNGCGYTVNDNFPTVYIRSPRYIIYRGEHLQCSPRYTPTVYHCVPRYTPTVYDLIYTVGVYRGRRGYTPWGSYTVGDIRIYCGTI